jgi:glycosyltransferase involved in cell wall biosynthesis
MRVLQLTDLYHPSIGGVETYVATLSRELVRLGHTVTVVTIQPGDQPADEVIDQVRVIRIPSWSQKLTRFYADSARPFPPPVPDPGAVAALRRIIRDERPDVVHSHSWLNYSFFPLYKSGKGPAHVVTLHDYGMACARKTLMRPGQVEQCAGPRLTRCLSCAPEQYGAAKGSVITVALRASRPLHRRVDRYLTVSAAAADGSRAALPRDAPVIPHLPLVSDDLLSLARDTPRPGFLPSTEYLMFAGALAPHKGIHVLLAAHRKMRNRLPLVLLGAPRPDTPATDGPDVITVRNVPHPQVMASWLRASIAVVPSVWHETLGFVAVEAMIAGCPVVASDVGGLREVVQDGSTGRLVPAGDADALAEALDSLTEQAELRKRLGEAAAERARLFGARNVVPRIVEVYEDALRDRSLFLALILPDCLEGRHASDNRGRGGAEWPGQ